MKITNYLLLIVLLYACNNKSDTQQATPKPSSELVPNHSPSNSGGQLSIKDLDKKIKLELLDPKIVEAFQEVQHKNDLFITEIEQLQTEMIDTTGGYKVPGDIKTIRGRRDKDITTRWLAYGEQGERLKNSILENRQNLLSLVAPEDMEEMKENITLNIDEEAPKSAGKTWNEYMFKYMPLGAVIPLLSQKQTNAKISELALYKYLSKKHPRKE